MPENTNLVPEWMDDKAINEVQFCRAFLQTHPNTAMICISCLLPKTLPAKR